ncbi:MAG: hypothetical protein RMK84_06060 [Oscillochloridaceae bacterium]|nr:hypothetical protein [Chloroflexaceae bacterium]MDW8389670.1 hypothetical protein [Oscillochloridaceae bacterium]
MTEGATAVYIALATTLVVWGTIALYLGRIYARLRELRRAIEAPPDPPASSTGPSAAPTVTESSVASPVPETPVTNDQPFQWLMALVALHCGCSGPMWLPGPHHSLSSQIRKTREER